MELTTRKERETSAKNCIREYIEEHKREKKPIKNRKQIYDDLKNKESFCKTTEPTFYRYLKQMNLDEVAPEQYDFITGRNPSFSALLEEKKYNRHMYLKILEPSYGPLIAEYLNYYYQGYDDAFHCIALQDILICFYYYSKDKTSTPSLTKKIIRKDIKTILKKISIAETK